MKRTYGIYAIDVSGVFIGTIVILDQSGSIGVGTDLNQSVNDMTPSFAIKKGSALDGLFDFWYSPTAWEQYGHNIMNGRRYTECIRSGKKPLCKEGFPDLVCVWRGTPWGKLTQDTTTQGYREDFPESRVFKKYNRSYINEKIKFPINFKKSECLCRYCTEERIRQRVLAKLDMLARRAELREKLAKKLAEFDRMWDKLERNGFVTPP